MKYAIVISLILGVILWAMTGLFITVFFPIAFLIWMHGGGDPRRRRVYYNPELDEFFKDRRRR